MQQTHISYRLLWQVEALGNPCQLLVKDTGKGQLSGVKGVGGQMTEVVVLADI